MHVDAVGDRTYFRGEIRKLQPRNLAVLDGNRVDSLAIVQAHVGQINLIGALRFFS